tara:strand:+ start:39616 stop:40107 length:492 start_codon:yes stop_codon:yes gene_type:complete
MLLHPQVAIPQGSSAVTEIVAAVLTHQDQLALLRRSELVTGDVGSWNCITGFLDLGCEPLVQAMTEVEEEAGISGCNLLLHASSVLNLQGVDGRLWRVHAFHFHTETRDLTLNWENDAYVWLHPDRLNELSTVSWFAQILDACGLGRSGPIVNAAECAGKKGI